MLILKTRNRVQQLIVSIALILFAISSIMFSSHQITAKQKISVDLALILAVDCSHSVSNQEFELQMKGLAKAFSDPEIISTISNMSVAIMLVQWSGSDNQVISVPWTLIGSEISTYRLSQEIAQAPRRALGKTSIAAVIDFAIVQFTGTVFQSNRQVIDISADGVNNDGTGTKSARQRAKAAGITINGLTILNDVSNLDSYFRQFITTGPGNFVIRANNYDDYGAAIKHKLLRELQGQPLS
ncbi:MAG: DUF1194 domain-containing protein [Hyphomicrobiales bacterium]|nr:DUF1194 domain-containing protein [Hyphomicrobiales bacterium]